MWRKRTTSRHVVEECENLRSHFRTIVVQEEGGSDSGNQIERQSDNVAHESLGRKLARDWLQQTLAQDGAAISATARLERATSLDQVLVTFLHEHGVKHFFSRAGQNHALDDKHADGVTFSQHEWHGGDEREWASEEQDGHLGQVRKDEHGDGDAE